MKKLLFILSIIVMLVCCSCGFVSNREYECDPEKVDSVQIVKLDEYVEGEYRFEYTILSEISDSKTFINRLNEVEHSVNRGDPFQLDVEYVVIKVNHSNGDFDLLHPEAQWLNRSGVNHYGFFFFDEVQFNALLSDYIEK